MGPYDGDKHRARDAQLPHSIFHLSLHSLFIHSLAHYHFQHITFLLLLIPSYQIHSTNRYTSPIQTQVAGDMPKPKIEMSHLARHPH